MFPNRMKGPHNQLLKPNYPHDPSCSLRCQPNWRRKMQISPKTLKECMSCRSTCLNSQLFFYGICFFMKRNGTIHVILKTFLLEIIMYFTWTFLQNDKKCVKGRKLPINCCLFIDIPCAFCVATFKLLHKVHSQ